MGTVTRISVAPSILETVGATPMVQLRRVTAGVHAAVLAKLEYFGPSGSVKDRILPYMVAQAERRGELRPGMTIIEGTTGNTGIATAMVGAARGYPVVIVMPEGMSAERSAVIRAYGAEVIFTPGGESDVDLVVRKVREIVAAAPDRYWVVDQFNNLDNPEAHYLTTGPEIWEQAGEAVDAFVAAVGTGGTLTGVARYLKERKPTVRVYAAEPSECAILSGEKWGVHKIEGIGDGFVPRVLDLRLLDGVVRVRSEEAIAMARRLAREEGIFCGISAGCNVVAALRLAGRYPDLRTVVTLIPDNGLRYLSTELCGVVRTLEVPLRDHALDAESRARLSQVRLDVI
ncbi:MAG: cysteine synthase A [Armatimonadota bacterium]|nr:cysteine synthase A [Armatimonadota bacterium]MDR7401135.1 cysteine synthase A [Armatimonadota bacterium]MDR7404335.1 cysteine synthase A [Armatimonadota bacterium]MDR7436430.1 cysteine synthase A [Armatimonadota bacterium]MDR7471789.1 cysteine synthase A [Armatimonadota bacterium]